MPKRILNKIRYFKQIIPFATDRHGGIRGILYKALMVLRKEGLIGFKLKSKQFRYFIQGLKSAGGFKRNDYQEWIRLYDTLTDEDLINLKTRQTEFPVKPLVSIIMPVYNPKPVMLQQAIESVCQQIYPCWELCIADDASTDPEIRKILTGYQEMDSRIKVVWRENNGNISACSNSALELATGEWVALLDDDDLMPIHALYWVVNTINQYPQARLIYSDEDKIDESGNRLSAYFKPDWNPDLFYSQNLFSHLGIYQFDLLTKAGRFRTGFEGSQDYDLALRCIELIDSTQIRHIPRVLYHWRAHSESAAFLSHAKPFAFLAGERALNDHFQRGNIHAMAKLTGSSYRVTYDLPDNPPLVSIIILTRNQVNLLRACIQSIQTLTTYPNYEIIVVDNGSDDAETLSYLNRSGKPENGFRVLRIDAPFNFSALNNAAVKEANGKFIALVNNDVQVITPDWLDEMMGHAVQPHVGAVGAKLFYPDNTVQHAGIILGLGQDGVAACAFWRLQRDNNGYFRRARLSSSYSAVTAACMVISKVIFEEMKGFNEVDLPIAYNDVDFCLRLREAGFRTVFTPFAELYHQESATRGFALSHQEQKRSIAEIEYFKKRWSDLLSSDPAYSPNLTLQYSDFSLAWPPRISKV